MEELPPNLMVHTINLQSTSFNRWGSRRRSLRRRRPFSLPTIATAPQPQSRHKLFIPPPFIYHRRCRRRRPSTTMLRRKPVFQAHLHPAGFTNTSIGKRKNLPAPPHRTCRLLLLARIAISRFVMPFQNPGLVAAVLSGGLDRRRADFANHHFSAVPIGFRTVVGF